MGFIIDYIFSNDIWVFMKFVTPKK